MRVLRQEWRSALFERPAPVMPVRCRRLSCLAPGQPHSYLASQAWWRQASTAPAAALPLWPQDPSKWHHVWSEVLT